jgi:hypothetical protein
MSWGWGTVLRRRGSAGRAVQECRAGIRACAAAILVVWALGPGAVPVAAQSAADLSARLVIDASLDDWQPAECVFRNAAVCSSLALPSPCDEEEANDDSAWSNLQDVHQIKVTWDARYLYIGVDAVIADHALLVLLDTQPGGLDDMTDLRRWRRAVRFGSSFQPDYLLAVQDRQRAPELWRVQSLQFLEPVEPASFRATASFQVEAADRALEAAIPWSVLFPDAALAVNPDPDAPETPMFVLPAAAATQGLRLQAIVAHSAEGFGVADVAPDASLPLSSQARDPAVLDRAVSVDWADASGAFVAFGAAIQSQTAPRFVPVDATPDSPPIRFSRLDTYDLDSPGTPATRLLLADAGHELGFVFDFEDNGLQRVYVSASIYSMRGEPMRVLVENALRTSSGAAAPWGRFSDPAVDRWKGDGRRESSVDAGMYILRVDAGPTPGVVTARQQRTIVVVR